MRISSLFILSIAMTSSMKAWACLPIPLEMRTDFYNDAVAQLLSYQNIRIDSLIKVEFADPRVISYEWIETDSGYECHDKEVLELKVSLAYQGNSIKEVCQLEGVVIKTEGFYSNAPKPSYEFRDVIDNCNI